MAELFKKQAKSYAESRPGYPPELFQFIASKTPGHLLAWDAGTGNGQAAIPLAGIYKKVVATDASLEQLSFAPKLSNIQYQHTPPIIPLDQLEHLIAPKGTVDLVTVAQAFHWFHKPTFFEQVNRVLRRPNGVLAVWCHTLPRINESVNAILDRVYHEADPYWDPVRQMVDEEYRTIEFPFESVEGTDGNGPFEFEEKRHMDLDMLLEYIRSWSAYQTAKEKGVELLNEEVVEEFKSAWGEDFKNKKLVKCPIFLRMGRVASEV